MTIILNNYIMVNHKILNQNILGIPSQVFIIFGGTVGREWVNIIEVECLCSYFANCKYTQRLRIRTFY